MTSTQFFVGKLLWRIDAILATLHASLATAISRDDDESKVRQVVRMDLNRQERQGHKDKGQTMKTQKSLIGRSDLLPRVNYATKLLDLALLATFAVNPIMPRGHLNDLCRGSTLEITSCTVLLLQICM